MCRIISKKCSLDQWHQLWASSSPASSRVLLIDAVSGSSIRSALLYGTYLRSKYLSLSRNIIIWVCFRYFPPSFGKSILTSTVDAVLLGLPIMSEVDRAILADQLSVEDCLEIGVVTPSLS